MKSIGRSETLAPYNRSSALAFRIMLSLIFLVAATNHLFQSEKIAERLVQAPFFGLVSGLADPLVLVKATGWGMILGGASLALGFRTRFAAALLASILIPITLTVQIGNPEGLGPLFKNIGLLGGLIFFAANGSFCCGFDQWLNRRQTAVTGKENL